MDNQDVMDIWKSYDKKLEESLTLNRKNAEMLRNIRVQSLLASMKPLKIIAILIGLIWVVFIDKLLINLFTIANPFFLISAGIQVVLTKSAIGLYIYQLVLIHRVDSSEPIVNTQQRIANLTASTIWVARILFLQLPVWTTFYWNKSMLTNGNLALYILQAVVTLGFTGLAIWLFLNINDKNRTKSWFRFLFNGAEWTPMIQAMNLLDQLNDYKSDYVSTPISANK